MCQYLVYPKHYDNDQALHLDIYRYSFSADPVSMLDVGVLMGYLPMNGRDQLRIRTGDAEVQRVIRMVGVAPTTGSYQLEYQGYKTPALAFNATIATIETELRNLPPFKRYDTQVAVSNTATLDNDMLITYGGKTSEFSDDFNINVIPLAGFDSVIEGTIDTEYVAGFPSGNTSYTVTVSGTMVHRLRSNRGEISVHST
eukprot:TRINITY_DN2310_c0_g1_i3.p1 TRINITY_DN2310_c0_g1~~TRINITY_DN2310_c0_g1_i3.p1  ORF type:complete len:199 (-),score=48.11 TRINITY_DN2310_c0_g1_i3:67-663(-)